MDEDLYRVFAIVSALFYIIHYCFYKMDNRTFLELICDPNTDLKQLAQDVETETFTCGCSKKFVLNDFYERGLTKEDWLKSDECPECYISLCDDPASFYSKLKDPTSDMEKLIKEELNKLTDEEKLDAYHKIESTRKRLLEEEDRKREAAHQQLRRELQDDLRQGLGEEEFQSKLTQGINDIMERRELKDKEYNNLYDNLKGAVEQGVKAAETKYDKLKKDLEAAPTRDTEIQCTMVDLVTLLEEAYDNVDFANELEKIVLEKPPTKTEPK